MATYVAFTQAANTPALPAGTTTGDWVVVFAYRDLNATAPTLPANWTQINVRNSGNGLLMAYREKTAAWTAPPAFTNATRAVAITVRPAAGKVLAVGVNAVQGATASNVAWAVQTLQVNNGTSVYLRGAVHTRPDATIGTATNHTLIESSGSRPGFITQRKTTTTDAAAATTTVGRSDVMSSGQVEIKDVDPPVSITQDAYRFYELGAEASSVALGAQNTAVTADMAAGDVYMKLRMRLQSTTTTAPAATDDWCLQWEKNASGTWADVSVDPAIALYTEANVSGSVTTTYQGNTGFGQSFDGTGKPVVEASFWMSRVGSPGGTLTAHILAHSGTYGTSSVATGADLATSTAVPVSAVPTTAGWVDFVFDGTFVPVAGTKYVVVWDHNSTFDASNNILSYVDTTTPTHAGNLVNKNFGGGFTATAGSDLIFEICGPPTGAAPWDDPSLTDGEATTNRLTGGTGTFEAGKVSEHGTIEDFGFSANNFTELVFSFRLLKADLVNADSLRFRIERNDDIYGMTFSAYPTINIVAPVAAITQAAYRFYDVTGTEAAGAALAAQNTPLVGELASVDHLSMLRVRMQSTTAFDLPATDDWRLQYRVNAGAWTNVTTTSGAVQAYNAPNVSNNDPTTERLTGGTGSFQAGKVGEQGTANNIGFLGNNYLEFVYTLQLQASLLANGDTVQFQVLRNALTTGVTYTQVPSISVVKTPQAVTQAAYQFYAEGTESGSIALEAQNTAPSINLAAGDAALQLRELLQSTTITAIPATDDWQLQYEKNASGTWIPIGSEALLTDQVGPTSSGRLLSSSLIRVGQSFLGDGNTLSRVAFNVDRTGNPPGNVRAYLYAHTGTFGTGTGTGSPLATSQPLPTSVVSNVINGMVSFSFGGGFTLESGVPYVIALGCDSATGLDISNAVNVWGRATGTHPGIASYTTNGTTWFTETWDAVFEVYTSPPSAGDVAPYASPLLTGGEPTTNRLTGGTGTFTAGGVSITGKVNDLGFPGNNFTEVVYSLQIEQTAFVDGDTVRFRVLKNGTTGNLTYSQTPQLNVVVVTATYTDTFDRADSGNLGPNWASVGSNPHEIFGNQARGAAQAVSYWSAATYSSDQSSEADFTVGVGECGPMVRVAAAQGYLVDWHGGAGGTFQWFKRITATTFTSLGVIATGVGTVGSKRLRLEVVGDTLSFYSDGSFVSSITDTTYPSGGAPGLWADGSSTYANNFTAVDLVGAVPPSYGSATVSWALTQTAAGSTPAVPIKEGSGTATWTATAAATGKRLMKGSATATHVWSVLAQGKRLMKSTITSAHVWSIAPATGKKYMSGSATAAHTWSVAVTSRKPMNGSATSAHVWSTAATGVSPVLPVLQGSATASHSWNVTSVGKRSMRGSATAAWQVGPGHLVSDEFNGPEYTVILDYGYIPMYDSTLYLDGHGNAIASGYGGVTHPNAVRNDSWMEIAFRLDDVASYVIDLLFKMPTASESNGIYTGYAVTISELGIGIDRLGANKVFVAQSLVNTQDYVVRVDWVGGLIRVFLDGPEVVNWTDPAPLVGNYVGLYLDNNYTGSSDRLRYLHADIAAIGQTPGGIGSATASHRWNVTPAQGRKPQKGQATSSHTWTIAPAQGKKIAKTSQVTAEHLWTIAPAAGVAPILGVKQGTAVASWTATVAPATGKRITKTTSMAASHVWTIAPATGKKVMKGQTSSLHLWSVDPATGKPIRKGQATSTHLWTVGPATGRRVTFGQATAEHLWKVLPATGIMPIVGVSQGTATARHDWSISPAVGKKYPQAQVTAAHTWTTTAIGQKYMRGQASSSHTWTITPATGKRYMKTTLVTASHLWNAVATGKRYMRGQSTSAHSWNTFPATGVMPILGVKQGTAISNHEWTTTAVGQKKVAASAVASHTWTTLATGKRTMRGSATAAHLWNTAAVGKRVLRSGQVTASHLWNLTAQGVRPAVGVKQGTAIAFHTWNVGPTTGRRITRGQATPAAHTWTASGATGKRVMRGQATSAHQWTSSASGKRVMGGSAAVTHLWSVSPSTGRMQPVALATVIHVWRSTAAGERHTSGSAVIFYRFNVSPARGSPGIVGVIQGMWNGKNVVALQYGAGPAFECLMVEA